MSEFGNGLLEGLTDEVFQIHEEVLNESSLFQLHILCDRIMNENPKAKFDGGFKIRIPTSLVGTGSTLDDFWVKFKGASKFLSCLYLSRSENSPGVMTFHRQKVSANDGLEFRQAAHDPQTYNMPSTNCCMEALNQGGPKAAVIHFYECLHSKSLVVDNVQTENHVSKKRDYEERQSMFVEGEPSVTCRRIEKSMRDKKYCVIASDSKANSGNVTDELDNLEFNFSPKKLTSNGDGENCSLYFSGVEETSDNFLYITSNFALAHLCHKNMITDLPGYYPGVSNPFVYLGGLHSFFPIHVEDMSLYSINYNHFGHPKLIILIAPSEVSRLSLLLTAYGMHWTGKECIYQLFHKTHVVFPQWLLKHGFKFKVIIQHPGEFIVFAPNAAHTGGNLGMTFGEACNFASFDWLPFGSVASQGRCKCVEGVHFDVTQLIKDHRKELLPFDLDKSLWASFGDEHFQRSLIIPPALHYSSTHDVAISSNPTTCHVCCRSEDKSQAEPSMVCPVKSCAKPFRSLNKRTLMNHLQQKHSKCMSDEPVQQYLKPSPAQMRELFDYDNVCAQRFMRIPRRVCASEEQPDEPGMTAMSKPKMDDLRQEIYDIWLKCSSIFEAFYDPKEPNLGYRLRVANKHPMKLNIKEHEAVIAGWKVLCPESGPSNHLYERSFLKDSNEYLGGPISYCNWCFKETVSVYQISHGPYSHLVKVEIKNKAPGTELLWNYDRKEKIMNFDVDIWFKAECCSISSTTVEPIRLLQSDIFQEKCVLCGLTYRSEHRDATKRHASKKVHFIQFHSNYLGTNWNGHGTFSVADHNIDVDKALLEAERLNRLLTRLKKCNWHVIPACCVLKETDDSLDKVEAFKKFKQVCKEKKEEGILVLRGRELASSYEDLSPVTCMSWTRLFPPHAEKRYSMRPEQATAYEEKLENFLLQDARMVLLLDPNSCSS